MNTLIRYLGAIVGRGRRARTAGDFELLFRTFRTVLESNTRALEIITEMGEVLGGDYLFDIQYVRRSYERLADALQSSIGQFEQLSAASSPRLREAFRRIDGSIRKVMDGVTVTAGEQVVWLEGVAEDAEAAVGGKMANLAAVKRAMPAAVPEGFIMTTRAFEVYLQHNRLLESLPAAAADGGSADAAGELAGRILQGEVPEDLHAALERAVARLRDRCGSGCSLAVRSSANEEDEEYSFAGQYETVLNVPLEVGAVERAYRTVIASLFSARAAAYRERFGFDLSRLRMAVGCMALVEPAASGVLYTRDPSGNDGRMVIASSWGLGTAVVDGRVDADQIVISRTDGSIIEERIGTKDVTIRRHPGGGTAEQPTEEDLRRIPSVSRGQITQLVHAATALEEQFRRPQDVEWAFDADGRLFILQSRPLPLPKVQRRAPHPAPEGSAAPIAFRNPGTVVQQGSAAGPVHIVRNDRDLQAVPRGAVLAVKHDSPGLVRVMTEVSAIITDTGSLASHMAALAREFRVPTVVNTGDATRVLVNGQTVTVDLGEEAYLYLGRIDGLLARSRETAVVMQDVQEFRQKRYLLRHIAPLNLIDPFRDDFTPEACRTLHDLLRFIHERSVGRLMEAAGFGARAAGAVRLDLPIPAGITVIDIGGGLQEGHASGHAAPEQLASVPLRAVVRGMLHPGAWRSEAVPLRMGDFLTSMLRAPDLVAESERQTGTNVAVVTGEYLNLNIKFGYHYTLLDSLVSGTPRHNHIYFRFAGGATDMTKRSRRLRVIARVLEEQGFSLSAKGDMIIARITGIGRREMEVLLECIGRLISYTRQLDAMLHNDADVERFADGFLKGRYELKGAEQDGGPAERPSADSRKSWPDAKTDT